jgi:hypothetical protein
MKTVYAAALAVAVLAPTAAATPAQAAPGCVTRQEYKAVRKTWWKSDVRSEFGTAGKQIFAYRGYTYRTETREYRACGAKYGYVSVTFEDGQVRAKSAIWL